LFLEKQIEMNRRSILPQLTSTHKAAATDKMRNFMPFIHPFTGIVAGPTGCGKTQLIKRLLQNYKLSFHPSPARIVWYYSEPQTALERELRPLGVEFQQGLPDLKEFDGSIPSLLIIDDCMLDSGDVVLNLFIKGSHHKNISVWFIVQNIFHKSKEMRCITLNAQYILLFKNPRDVQQIKILARQMYGGGKDAKVLDEAFADATGKPYGYILLDLKQSTPDHLRLRTNVVPGEALTVYAGKRAYKHDIMQIPLRS